MISQVKMCGQLVESAGMTARGLAPAPRCRCLASPQTSCGSPSPPAPSTPAPLDVGRCVHCRSRSAAAAVVSFDAWAWLPGLRRLICAEAAKVGGGSVAQRSMAVRRAFERQRADLPPWQCRGLLALAIFHDGVQRHFKLVPCSPAELAARSNGVAAACCPTATPPGLVPTSGTSFATVPAFATVPVSAIVSYPRRSFTTHTFVHRRRGGGGV